MSWLAPALAGLVTLLVLDGLWLGLVARGFYKREIGTLLAATPNWTAAALFYALYLFAVLYFAVFPGLERQSLAFTLQRAAVLGLVAYGTYDLTNWATLAHWSAKVVVADMLWGVVITAAMAWAAYTVAERF